MHDFLPDRTITRSFIDLPGQGFSSPGRWNVADAALVRVGMKYRLSEQASLFGSLDSTLSPTWWSVSGTAGLQVNW